MKQNNKVKYNNNNRIIFKFGAAELHLQAIQIIMII